MRAEPGHKCGAMRNSYGKIRVRHWPSWWEMGRNRSEPGGTGSEPGAEPGQRLACSHPVPSPMPPRFRPLSQPQFQHESSRRTCFVGSEAGMFPPGSPGQPRAQARPWPVRCLGLPGAGAGPAQAWPGPEPDPARAMWGSHSWYSSQKA